MFARLLLVIITLAVLFLQNSNIQHTLRIDDPNKFHIITTDDRSSGGSSRASVRFKDDKWQLKCTIKKSNYQWPYCEARFIPISGSVDLSNFDSVTISSRYRSDKNNQAYATRFQLRNFNEAYSTESNEDSFKYIGIEYFTKGQYPSIIPLERMQVLSWWIIGNKIPMDQQGTEKDDVRFIELATGNNMAEGVYIIDIEAIEFSGKWMKDSIAYLLLVFMWLFASIVYFVHKIWLFSKRVRQLKKQENELSRKNTLLENKQKELQDKAHSDPLTGVLNRAGLNHFLEQNNAILYHGELLSILYLDLDHFKKVNDQFGHHTGDEVLINFTNIIELQTRDSDLFVRWGGEEFVLVCPNTDLEQAILLAEKLRRSVEYAHWPEHLSIKVSVGVAQMKNESIEALMERADQALYRAKNKGRNRVEVAT